VNTLRAAPVAATSVRRTQRFAARIRLTAATRRGLRAVRSLAQITVDNAIDMTGAELSEMKLAIGWLDKQLAKFKDDLPMPYDEVE